MYRESGGALRMLVAEDRPQERMERLGAGSLQDAELLAMLLRSGRSGQDVLSLARELLQRAGSLSALARWSAADFASLPGIGRVKALQLLAVVELAGRLAAQQIGEEPLLEEPAAVFHFLKPRVSHLDVETFWVLSLNRRNRLRAASQITQGTATASLVHPRECFREAIRQGAAAVVVAHNHPSGDPAPSAADIKVTRTLRQASNTLDVPLLDHVIIGSPPADPLSRGYYSFSESGLL